MKTNDLKYENYYSTKITTKWQTTIPPEVREALGLEVGDLISYTIKDDGRVEVVNFYVIAEQLARQELEEKGMPVDEGTLKSIMKTIRRIQQNRDME